MNGRQIRTIILCCICIFFSLLLSSCSYVSTSADDVISVPASQKTQNTIKKSIEEFCGKDAVLVYTSRGRNQNPVTFCDIDGGGSEETVITYRNSVLHPENGERINIMILHGDGDSYDEYFDITGKGYDIDMYEFVDINGDGKSELVVGYITSEIIKTIYVYSFNFDEGTFTVTENSRYTDWVLTDIDGDGIQDIVFVYYDTIQGNAYASAIKVWENGVVSEISAEYTPLSTNNGFYMMQTVTGADEKNAVFVSSKQGTLLSSTEILVWDDELNTLVNISYTSEVNKEAPVKNVYPYFCSLGSYLPSDINGDGYTEIPLCYMFNESDIHYNMMRLSETIQYLYGWYRYENGLTKLFDSYINENNYYIFIINEDWSFRRVTVFQNYNRDFLFYYVESDAYLFSDDSAKKVLLFTIKTTDIKKDEDKNTVFLKENNGTYYYLEINGDVPKELGQYIPPVDELKEAFRLTIVFTASGQ